MNFNNAASYSNGIEGYCNAAELRAFVVQAIKRFTITDIKDVFVAHHTVCYDGETEYLVIQLLTIDDNGNVIATHGDYSAYLSSWRSAFSNALNNYSPFLHVYLAHEKLNPLNAVWLMGLRLKYATTISEFRLDTVHVQDLKHEEFGSCDVLVSYVRDSKVIYAGKMSALAVSFGRAAVSNTFISRNELTPTIIPELTSVLPVKGNTYEIGIELRDYRVVSERHLYLLTSRIKVTTESSPLNNGKFICTCQSELPGGFVVESDSYAVAPAGRELSEIELSNNVIARTPPLIRELEEYRLFRNLGTMDLLYDNGGYNNQYSEIYAYINGGNLFTLGDDVYISTVGDRYSDVVKYSEDKLNHAVYTLTASDFNVIRIILDSYM